jgi:hypothetical protein
MCDFTECHGVFRNILQIHVYYTTHMMHMSCVGCGYRVLHLILLAADLLSYFFYIHFGCSSRLISIILSICIL